MELIRVVIADDDPEVRTQVKVILGSTDDIRVAADAASAPEAVEATDRHRPDVVLMDIEMPGNGLDATDTILRRHPGQAVVILTTFGEQANVDRALRLGVSGFLLKTGDPLELIRGIRSAAEGGATLSPRIAAMVIRQMATRADTASRAAVHHLAPRELQILLALAQGLSNAEIATTQHLTEGTVKGYVSALFVRLGVRNRVEAAIMAHHAGLLR